MADFTQASDALTAAATDLFRAATRAPRTVAKQLPFNPNPDAGLAISKHFMQHWKEMGSAVGEEHYVKQGTTVLAVYQAFANGIWRWRGEDGVTEVGAED